VDAGEVHPNWDLFLDHRTERVVFEIIYDSEARQRHRDNSGRGEKGSSKPTHTAKEMIGHNTEITLRTSNCPSEMKIMIR
jgi:hypothetical protein